MALRAGLTHSARGHSLRMRRTSAALLAVLTLALGAAGCGRNENPQGSPDGQGESLEERKKDTGTTTTQ